MKIVFCDSCGASIPRKEMESPAFLLLEGDVYCASCTNEALRGLKKRKPVRLRGALIFTAIALVMAAVAWLALAKKSERAVLITSPLSRWTRDELLAVDVRARGAPSSSRPRLLVNGVPAAVESEGDEGTLTYVAALREGENEITAELGTSMGSFEPVQIVVGGRAQRLLHVRVHREQPALAVDAPPEHTAAEYLAVTGRASVAFGPVRATVASGPVGDSQSLLDRNYSSTPLDVGPDGAFEFVWQLPANDGYAAITIRADDALGNTRLRTVGVWVDRSPPVVVRVQAPEFTRGGIVAVPLTASDASPVTVQVGDDGPPSAPAKKLAPTVEASWIVQLLDGDTVVETRRADEGGRFTFRSTGGVRAEFERYVCSVTDAAGNVWEGSLGTDSPPAAAMDRTEPRRPEPEVRLRLDQFELLERRDYSNALAEKIDHKVLVPRVLTEAEIRTYCEHAIAAEKEKGPIAGIWLFFLLDESDLDRGWTAGFAEWGPDGHAGNASDVPRGDYSRHRIRVELMPEFPEDEILTRIPEEKRKSIYRELYYMEDAAETERELQALHERFRARHGLTEEELERIVVEAMSRHW